MKDVSGLIQASINMVICENVFPCISIDDLNMWNEVHEDIVFNIYTPITSSIYRKIIWNHKSKLK